MFFQAQIREKIKALVSGLCAGNSPVTGAFLAQKASDAGIASIWWRHHVYVIRNHNVRIAYFQLSISTNFLTLWKWRIQPALQWSADLLVIFETRIFGKLTSRMAFLVYNVLGLMTVARAVMLDGIANWWFPLKSVAGKTFLSFPAHAQLTILRIWQEAYGTLVSSLWYFSVFHQSTEKVFC